MSGRSAPTRIIVGFPFGSVMGGAERVLRSLLRHRERAGVQIHLVCFQDGPFVAEATGLGVPVTVIDPGRFRHPWRLILAIVRLARLLRTVQPDLCVSWLPRVQTVMAPAALLSGHGKRIVFFQHEVPKAHGLARLATVLPCRWVIACSASVGEATRGRWPHRDGSVVWPGIEAPVAPAPAELALLRHDLELHGGWPVIGIVGRLLTWKGQDRLIDAVGLLRDRGLHVVLLIVGGSAHGVEAELEERLRARAHELDLADRVRFCGHVPDATMHVAVMDLLVNASNDEPFGIVLLEAMALGVPVLAVDRGGPREIVREGSGMLVATGSPPELADAVADLLSDPQRRRALAAAGRARFDEHFSAERMVKEVGRDLAGVAGERVTRRR
ncbi:MAG: glycosyltransferase [Solirubrobacterales bacterium]|nr:glycosyltransferase [Solirubrobacterales bacterium]